MVDEPSVQSSVPITEVILEWAASRTDRPPEEIRKVTFAYDPEIWEDDIIVNVIAASNMKGVAHIRIELERVVNERVVKSKADMMVASSPYRLFPRDV